MQIHLSLVRTGLAGLVGAVLSACGGGSDDAPPAAPSTATRSAAATSTAQNNAACTAIRPFYWEIGDRTQRLASASVNQAGNATTYTADTVMAIASASKWLYGAYVAERRSGMLTAQDIQFLTFTSGYTSLGAIGDCLPGDTVAACVARGDNNTQTPPMSTGSITTAATCRSTRASPRRAWTSARWTTSRSPPRCAACWAARST